MRKIKINWKALLITAGSLLLVVAMLGGFSVFAKDTVKVAGIGEWKLGDLDPVTGKYVKSEQAIYTKDKFECYGLRVEPDFEAKATFDVYFYNEDDILIEKKLGLSDTYSSKLEHAQYARIVIHPEIPEDVKEKDFKISLFDVSKYSSKFKVTVYKEDSKYGEFNNLYNEDLARLNAKLQLDEDRNLIYNSIVSGDYEHKVAKDIPITGEFDCYDVFIYVPLSQTDETHWFGIFEGTGAVEAVISKKVDTLGLSKPVWAKITLDVSEIENFEDVYLSGFTTSDSKVYIYGYNK